MSTRSSAYRRSYGGDRRSKPSSVSSVHITPEMKEMREAEKTKLKKCNNRLVVYIEKVHDLEEANKILAAQNELLKNSGKYPQRDVGELYEDELRKLKEKLEDLTAQNKTLENEVDNLEDELKETVEKLDEERDEKKAIEKEVKDLRKDVDDATIERVGLESKTDNLQDTLELERQAYAMEVENLRNQIQPVKAAVVENQPSTMPDLNDAVSDVRKYYEDFTMKNLESMEALHRDKCATLNNAIKSVQDDNKHLLEDNNNQKMVIHDLEMQLELLRSKNDKFKDRVDELEDDKEKQSSDAQEKITQMEKELVDAKQEIGDYLKRCQELSNLKASLENEIGIYYNILSAEETRIRDVEVADTKFIVPEKARDEHRRSRSGSESSASSRSISDVVDDLLENDTPKDEEKGVISVTWKVKGGTVCAVDPFNSDDDAEKIRNALKGFGTDEKTIIDILGKRSKGQRMAICEAYKRKYNEELLNDLKKELSGDFQTVVLHLMWQKSVMDANSLRKALKGFGTDEAVLIEILCTQGSRELEEIKKQYAREFPGRDLEQDIEKETSGAFKSFLLAVLKTNRPEDSGTVVANKADEDAQELFNMKVKDWSPSNEKFLEIFTQRSFEHLWFLFNQSWPKVSSENLLETIDADCKGDLKRGLTSLIRFSVYIPPVYYATQLYEGMKGFGTEDNQIIYIVTTRCEIDMVDIKEEFNQKYGVSLATKIKDETRGDYREMLLVLIGEN